MKKQPNIKKIENSIYYNINLVADKLGVSYNTVWQKIANGELRAVKIGAYYIRRDWFREFIVKHPEIRKRKR